RPADLLSRLLYLLDRLGRHRSSLSTGRLLQPRTLQGLGERLHDLILLGLRKAQDLLQGDADVRDVRGDVGALLLVLRELPPVAQEAAEPPAALLEPEPQLADDLGVGGYRLLALGGERHPDARDVHEQHHRPEWQ